MSSRKEYVAIARVLSMELAVAQCAYDRSEELGDRLVMQVQNIMRSLADTFRRDNTAFDRSRFYIACGFDCTGYKVVQGHASSSGRVTP